jgi:hypothetical protein
VLVRVHQAPVALTLGGLDDVARTIDALSARLGNRGGYRGVVTDAAAGSEPVLDVELDGVWDRIGEVLQQQLWAPLRSHLDGIERLSVVRHGVLHLLPLTTAAPQALHCVPYPELISYHNRRVNDGAAAAPAIPDGDLGLHHYAGDNNEIPLAEVESALVQAVWSGRSVMHPCAYPRVTAPLPLWHVACHGLPDERQPIPDLHQAEQIHFPTALYLQRGRVTGVPEIQTARHRVTNAILQTCISGRLVEDLDGNPIGLVSALFRRGARTVVAASVSLPDRWAPVLSLLLHQTLRHESVPLGEALRLAQRRLEAGDWYEDTETLLRNALRRTWEPEVMSYLARWFGYYWDSMQPWDARGLIQYLDDLAARSWLPELEDRTELWQGLEGLDIDGREGRRIVREDRLPAIAAMIVERRIEPWIRERIPPQPDLGVLLHAVQAFGE